jgi:hypothetical protein
MPLADVSVGALLDREIMLSCLAEAVGEEPAGALGSVFRHGGLQAHIRATRLRREAIQQGAGARWMRTEATLACEDAPRPRQLPDLRARLATGRLELQLRRCNLAVSRSDAADLRSNARALRGEASQIRRRARRPYG